MKETTFGQRLRELRKQYGKTQSQVTQSTEIDQANYSRIENDKSPYHPSNPTIWRLVAAIGVSRQEEDELYVLAGRVPPDVTEKLLRNPEWFNAIRKGESNGKV